MSSSVLTFPLAAWPPLYKIDDPFTSYNRLITGMSSYLLRDAVLILIWRTTFLSILNLNYYLMINAIFIIKDYSFTSEIKSLF